MKSLFPLLKFLDKGIEEYYKIIIFIPFLGPHNMETISTSISSIAQSCQWVNYARHACNE